MLLTEVEKAYFAGLVDAEMALTISRSVVKNKMYLQPYIELSNLSEEMIDWVIERWRKGSKYVRKRKKYPNRIYHCGMLTGANSIIEFLSLVEPYIISKKQHISLMISYCKSREINKRKRREERGYTDDEIRIYWRLRKLYDKKIKRKTKSFADAERFYRIKNEIWPD